MLEQGKQPLMPGPWSPKLFSLPVSFSHACTHGVTCPGEASSANSCPQAPLWARAGHTGFRSSLRRLASWQRPLLAWKWGWAGVQVILGSRYLEHGQEGGPKLLVGSSHGLCINFQPKMKVLAVISSEAPLLGLQGPPSPCVLTRSSLCECAPPLSLRVHMSSPSKATRKIGLGPIPRASL